MTRKIWTIGYTGLSVESFVQRLNQEAISVLVDVREIPLSRKKGFSKTALAARLAESGIEYLHRRPLGSPKALRHQVRLDRDYSEFFAELRGYYSGLLPAEAFNEVAALAKKRRACLMCCCADVSLCHRSILSEVLEDTYRFQVAHLDPTVVARRAA